MGGKNIKKRKKTKNKTCYQTIQNVTAAVQYDRELRQPTQPNNFGTECKKNRGEKRKKLTHKTFFESQSVANAVSQNSGFNQRTERALLAVTGANSTCRSKHTFGTGFAQQLQR